MFYSGMWTRTWQQSLRGTSRLPQSGLPAWLALETRGLGAGKSVFAERSFERLRRRCQRLTYLLNRLSLPKVSSFFANGKRYALPFRADTFSGRGSGDSHETTNYCAGVFDGDGCVYSDLIFTQPCLIIEQSSWNGEVLLKFVGQFGGAIYSSKSIEGRCQSTIRWVIYGEHMQQAAQLLSIASCCKRDQLEIVAMDVPGNKEHRLNLASRLRALKREAPQQRQICSWAYIAGFFDAEGCISIPPTGARVVLVIGQKYKEVLVSIKSVLENSFPGIHVCIIRNGSTGYQLSLHRTSFSRMVLHKLLVSGLTAKKEQAELALSLTRHNHVYIRDTLSRLKGNQSRGKFLDADGCERAKRIKRMRSRLRYFRNKGDDSAADSLQDELESFKRTHRFKNLETRATMLRADCRMLLTQGVRRRVS